jgi:hypothetical protein
MKEIESTSVTLQPAKSGATDIVRNMKGTDMTSAVFEYYILVPRERGVHKRQNQFSCPPEKMKDITEIYCLAISFFFH